VTVSRSLPLSRMHCSCDIVRARKSRLFAKCRRDSLLNHRTPENLNDDAKEAL